MTDQFCVGRLLGCASNHFGKFQARTRHVGLRSLDDHSASISVSPANFFLDHPG
jgi:hypothetical protein